MTATAPLPVRAPSDSLDERVALVTGAGSGLGAEICAVLSARGLTVIATDVDETTARRTADRLEASPAPVIAMAMNVGDPPAVEQVVGEVIAHTGRLDVVVNNAGVDRTAAFEELTLEDWDRIIAVNLRGPVAVARAAWDAMAKSGRGHLINITSTAAKRAWPNASAYHATKWGLLGLSHALHAEGRERGIKVTAVVAGGMRTPFLLDRFPEIDLDTLQDPRRVAEVVRFLIDQPVESVIPEVTVLPMKETSWP